MTKRSFLGEHIKMQDQQNHSLPFNRIQETSLAYSFTIKSSKTDDNSMAGT